MPKIMTGGDLRPRWIDEQCCFFYLVLGQGWSFDVSFEVVYSVFCILYFVFCILYGSRVGCIRYSVSLQIRRVTVLHGYCVFDSIRMHSALRTLGTHTVLLPELDARTGMSFGSCLIQTHLMHRYLLSQLTTSPFGTYF